MVKTTPGATRTTENQHRTRETKPPHQKQHATRPKLKKGNRRCANPDDSAPISDDWNPKSIPSEKAKLRRTQRVHGNFAARTHPNRALLAILLRPVAIWLGFLRSDVGFAMVLYGRDSEALRPQGGNV